MANRHAQPPAQAPTEPPGRRPRTAGLGLGLLATVLFSGTLPLTRIAVGSLDPVAVTLVRIVIATSLAVLILLITRQRLPRRALWPSLIAVAVGNAIGFPLLTALAMEHVPAAHGAVVLGLLPLFTAGAAALRAGERPSAGFWLSAFVGSAVTVAFALRDGAGQFHIADLALLGAVVSAAIAYAEGGRLARELGGWQVISWALVLAAPLLLGPVLWQLRQYSLAAPPQAWLAVFYLGGISQFGAFFAWYGGLALGGIARVGLLQLLQPFLTVLVSALLLGEEITWLTVAAALAVAATVFFGRRAPVRSGLARDAALPEVGD